MLIYWFITQLFSGTAGIVSTEVAQGDVAYIARVGGFVAGYIIGKLFPNEQNLVFE